jgi:catechol 2,3-dioxygenase-like lactoylglutathione lyase family enzyme
MVTGINHVTLAVREVEQSCDFYRQVLGCRLVARWPSGAYLVVGDAWIALMRDPSTRPEALPEYTHLAFSVAAEDFDALSQRIVESGARVWKTNRSEGASLYFEDPNGHKLEIHVGDLASRLRSAREAPWPGLDILDPDA